MRRIPKELISEEIEKRLGAEDFGRPARASSCLKIDEKKIEEALESFRVKQDIEDIEAGRIAWELFLKKWKKSITICEPDEKTFLHAFAQGCKWQLFRRRNR